jgi:hypothetical protein
MEFFFFFRSAYRFCFVSMRNKSERVFFVDLFIYLVNKMKDGSAFYEYQIEIIYRKRKINRRKVQI